MRAATKRFDASKSARAPGSRSSPALDLDLVILSNIDTLVIGYERWVKAAMYWHPGASWNPSVLLMRTGIMHELWEQFEADPQGVSAHDHLQLVIPSPR